MGAPDESQGLVAVQTPLSRILAQEVVPFSVLNEAYEMAQNPAHISAFADPLLVPSCMCLILEHTPGLPKRIRPKLRSRRKVSRDEPEERWVDQKVGSYVLMCMQLMAISLQSYLFGDSERHAYLKALKDSPSSSIGPDGRPDFLFDFGSHVARAIHEEFSETSKFLMDLGRRKIPLSHPVSLPTLESLGQNYAEALVGMLYLQRDTILAARYAEPTVWKGWSVLFYQLWVYIRGIRETKRLFVYLRDLICRFVLVNSGDVNEYNLLQLIVQHLVDATGDGVDDERNRPMSIADMETITEAYCKRLSQTSADDPPPGMEFSLTLLRWILPGLNSKTRCMLLPIVEASMRRLWHAFESGDTATNAKKGLINNFSLNLFTDVQLFLEDKDVKEEDKVLLVNILMKHDVADLIGRIILLPTLDRLKGANRRYFSSTLMIARERITTTNLMLHEVAKRYQYTQDDFNGWYPTHQATRNLAALDNDLIVRSIREEWMSVGYELGMSRRQGWGECAFPRCPMPLGPVYYACGGCSIPGYCSKKCQNEHWDFEVAPAYRHKKKCPALAKKPQHLNYTVKKDEWELYAEFNKEVPPEVYSDQEDSSESESSESGTNQTGTSAENA